MSRLTLAVLVCTAAALAQNASDIFNKPPEDVDKALRARIGEFYQDHVDGKFREAESLVAEDTKDFFYNGNKPRYLSFSIQRIDYSDNFTKAKAVILCEQRVMMPGFSDKPLKIPSPSTWKLVDGKWYWYVDQDAIRQSPFGKMTPGAMPASGPVPSPSAIPKNPAFVMNQVKADKQALELAPGASAQVTIANAAPGPMTLSVDTPAPRGIEAKFASPALPAQGRTTLTVKAGEQAKSGVLNIMVMPTGEIIPIRITVR